MSLPLIAASYTKLIRPLQEAVQSLHRLKVIDEGIKLPSIVVVGERNSGKSSVLESLVGIRVKGSTVPLIFKLQDDPSNQPLLFLEYNGNSVPSNVDEISGQIEKAIAEMVGSGNGISTQPIKVTIKMTNLPTIEFVVLPGLSGISPGGQRADADRKISEMIEEDSIILNVLAADGDFSASENIRIADKDGQRTLTVITKCDISEGDLMEKIDEVVMSTGLGYVCVRNQLQNEAYEDARAAEKLLFEKDAKLSHISKSMVGISCLVTKLFDTIAIMIRRRLPNLLAKMIEKNSKNCYELSVLPQPVKTEREAYCSFAQVLKVWKGCLKNVQWNSELTVFLKEFFDKLWIEYDDGGAPFLAKELEILDEIKNVGLVRSNTEPQFFLLHQERVEFMSSRLSEFLEKVWDYVSTIMVGVLTTNSKMYPLLVKFLRRATQILVLLKKKQSLRWASEILEMEKLEFYTSAPEYINLLDKLMAHRNKFIEIISSDSLADSLATNMYIELFGNIELNHLRGHPGKIRDAFDVRMKLASYWTIVRQRLVDAMAFHMFSSISKMVDEFDQVFTTVGGVDNWVEMMAVDPAIAQEQEKLIDSITKIESWRKKLPEIMEKFD